MKNINKNGYQRIESNKSKAYGFSVYDGKENNYSVKKCIKYLGIFIVIYFLLCWNFSLISKKIKKRYLLREIEKYERNHNEINESEIPFISKLFLLN